MPKLTDQWLTSYSSSEPAETKASLSPSDFAIDWNNGFSDPHDNSNQRYRYLVHGVGNESRLSMQKAYLMSALQKEGLKPDQTQDIDLLTHPEYISRKKVISTSVIDEEHRATYGEAGFILRCPAENVLKLSPQDNGTFFPDPDETIKKLRSENHLSSLDDLMVRTGKHGDQDWNEVILQGSTDFGQVEIIGCFIKVNRHGQPIDPDMAAKIQTLAIMNNWPLFEFEGYRKEYKPSEPDIYDHGAGYNIEGYRYWLDFKRQAFSRFDEEYHHSEMTQEEARNTIARIEAHYDTEQLDDIREKLEVMKRKVKELPLTRNEELAIKDSTSPYQGFKIGEDAEPFCSGSTFEDFDLTKFKFDKF